MSFDYPFIRVNSAIAYRQALVVQWYDVSLPSKRPGFDSRLAHAFLFRKYLFIFYQVNEINILINQSNFHLNKVSHCLVSYQVVCYSKILMLFIFTSIKGLSLSSVPTCSISVTTSIPLVTLPKTVCLLLSHGVGTQVMKNQEPFVFGPALAILSINGES